MAAVNNRAFLLLVSCFLCTVFGGLQSITILEWLQPLLLLQFLHHAKILDLKRWPMFGVSFLTVLALTLGYSIAYAGEFNMPGYTVRGLLISSSMSLGLSLVSFFAFMTAVSYQKRFPDAVSSHPFAFPCVWTMIWHIESSFAPIGTTGNPAYSQHAIQPIVVTAAFWGLDGIVFFMAFTATILHQRLVIREEGGERAWFATSPTGSLSESAAVNGSSQLNYSRTRNFGRRREDGEDDAEEARGGGGKSAEAFVGRARQHDTIVNIWFGVMVVLFLYSGVRQVILSENFFERGIEETVKPTVGVSCILRQPKGLAEDMDRTSIPGPRDFLWNATAERASAGDAFIIWSEAATFVQGAEGEEELLSQAREILSIEQVRRQSSGTKSVKSGAGAGSYLGLSYTMMVDDTKSYNVFTLLAPDGSLGFRYEKSHPVPFVEGNTIEGPGELEAIKTPYGTVSAAICFDFQFPRLHEKASYLGVDIMLQPSWTWGPMAKIQHKYDAFRAVENGYTMVRCSSVGVSAVITPYNEVIDLRESVTTSVVTMELPISGKVFTLYAYGGFLFGILVATVAMKYMFMAWLPMTWVMAVSNIFPGSVNVFFAGDSHGTEGIVKRAYQRTITGARSFQRTITRTVTRSWNPERLTEPLNPSA